MKAFRLLRKWWLSPQASLSDDIKKTRDAANARTQEEVRRLDQEIEDLKSRKKFYDPMLLQLKELIDSLRPETSQAKAARELAETQLREKLKSVQKELAKLSANPLLSLPPNGVPLGKYRLLARTPQGGEVLLLEFEVTP